MILLPLGCTSGLSTQLEPDPTTEGLEGSFYQDAMPLVSAFNYELYKGTSGGIDFLKAGMDYYEGQIPLISLNVASWNPPLNLPNSTETVNLTAYSFLHQSTSSQKVLAITSGLLYYLPKGKSDPNLLGGAIADENLLILKPLPGTDTRWKSSHPGTKPLLEECVYQNVDLLTDGDLLKLVSLTEPDAYCKKKYEEKFGPQLENTRNWQSEYLALFKSDPEVCIIVKGGEQIASTLSNNSADPQQRLTLFFKLGGKWADHDQDVRSFFRYDQRRGLAGHPMIAKVLNQSVKAGSVDVIPLSNLQGWSRSKNKLIDDFISSATSTNPPYHPLALDLEQEPCHLTVPKPLVFPVPVVREDQLVSRFIISNPLELPITISGSLPTGVSMVPMSFSAAEQVVEVKALDSAPELPISDVDITISVEDGETTFAVFQILLTLREIRGIPVRFFKLMDKLSPTNPAHTTDIDLPKLLQVIDYANNILGSQASVYIYPVELNGVILHDLNFDGDLGNPIVEVESIWNQLSAVCQVENLNVVFVWDSYDGSADPAGMTTGHLGLPFTPYMMILLDTKNPNGMQPNNETLGPALVHEIGHWFSKIFIFWKNDDSDCGGLYGHFQHGKCLGGDWSLYSNVMGPENKIDNLFISLDQAGVINLYAGDVTVFTGDPNQ